MSLKHSVAHSRCLNTCKYGPFPAVDDSDVPGQSNGNCSDDVVNGRCDLLDFFPVWLDLKHILAALPPGNGVEYRLRSRGLRFVYTGLTNGAAGSYLREECGTCGERLNQKAFEATTLPCGDTRRESETVLSKKFLDELRIDGAKGILMVEGVSTFASLHLDVVRSATDELIVSARLPLSLSNVEDMINRVNLRGGGEAVVTPGCAIPPDKGTNVVFLHGLRVNPEMARAWGSECFKKLWQCGSNARFHSVTWFSDDGYLLTDWLEQGAFKYHVNVCHAFDAAPHLKDYVNGLSGRSVIMAHSL